jgi:hypothetical protein
MELSNHMWLIAPVDCARELRPWIAPVGLGNMRGKVLAKRVSIMRLLILLTAI